MGSKITLLLGSLIAAIIAFTCIQNNRSLLTTSKEAGQSPQTVSQSAATHVTETNRTEPLKESVIANTATNKTIAKVPASLLYRSDPTPSLHVSLNKQDETIALVEALSRFCNPSKCNLSTEFNETIQQADWQNDALALLEEIHKSGLQKVRLQIEDKNLSVTAILPDEKERTHIQAMLDRFTEKGFDVDANLTLPLTSVSDKNASVIETNASVEPAENMMQKDAKQTGDQNRSALTDLQQKRIMKVQKSIDTLLKTHPIYFKRDSNELTLTSKQILDKIIALVNKNSEEIERLRILGHTDASGSAAYNKQLSQKRAESVKNYLHAHHIKVQKLEAIGYGEEKPLTKNPYDKRNRRVEIEIVKEQSHD